MAAAGTFGIYARAFAPNQGGSLQRLKKGCRGNGEERLPTIRASDLHVHFHHAWHPGSDSQATQLVPSLVPVLEDFTFVRETSAHKKT